MIINLYQSDVTAMPDAQLAALSAELEEAYQQNGGEESYWTDDAAEVRFYEMSAEIRRRWELANPEEAAKRRAAFGAGAGSYVRFALSALAERFELASAIGREFDGKFKVGDTITVRKPYRFMPQ